MRVEFMVPVIVSAKPKRAKENKTVIGAVYRTVDIPEVTEANAPVVVSSYFPADENDNGDLIYREYRELDGHLYVDITEDGNVSQKPTITKYVKVLPPYEGVERLFSNILGTMPNKDIKGAVYPSVTAAEVINGDIKSFAGLETLGLTDIDERTLELFLSVFDHEASKLLLVDGKFHLRERPPVFEVIQHYSSRGNRTEIKPSRRNGDGSLVKYNDPDRMGTPIALFQFDQLGSAVAFAEALGDPVGLTETEAITVEQDAAVHFNAASATINAIAVAMNDAIAWPINGDTRGRELLNLLTVEVMHAYHRLEAILPGLDEENIPEELVEIVESVLVLPPKQRQLFITDGRASPASIWAALQLWHERPVELSLTAAPSGSAPSKGRSSK
jgi:hypothetical protein